MFQKATKKNNTFFSISRHNYIIKNPHSSAAVSKMFVNLFTHTHSCREQCTINLDNGTIWTFAWTDEQNGLLLLLWPGEYWLKVMSLNETLLKTLLWLSVYSHMCSGTIQFGSVTPFLPSKWKGNYFRKLFLDKFTGTRSPNIVKKLHLGNHLQESWIFSGPEHFNRTLAFSLETLWKWGLSSRWTVLFSLSQ